MEQVTITFKRGDKLGYYTQAVAKAAECDSLSVLNAMRKGQFHYPENRGWEYYDWKFTKGNDSQA